MDNRIEKRMQELEAKNIKPRFKTIHIDELMNTKFPDAKWLVDKLVPLECITILSGAPASYKTWILLQMAIDIANGEKFVNIFQCTKAGVLIINEEDHARLIKERLGLLGIDGNLEINIISQSNFAVLEEKDLKEILDICNSKKIDVIFIDSLVRISDNDENDAKQMSKVFKNIRRFCQAGKTVVITHHERKEGFVKSSAQARLRGSSDIPASIDSHLAVQRDKKDRQKLRFEQAKNRFSQEVEPFLIRVAANDEGINFRIEDGVFDEKEEDVREAIEGILTEFKEDGLLTKEVAEKVRVSISVSPKKITEILKDMASEGVVICKSGAKNEKRYLLAESEEQDEVNS